MEQSKNVSTGDGETVANIDRPTHVAPLCKVAAQATQCMLDQKDFNRYGISARVGGWRSALEIIRVKRGTGVHDRAAAFLPDVARVTLMAANC